MQKIWTCVGVLSVVFYSGCATQYDVKPVKAEMKPTRENGVYYTLPKTVFSLELPMVITAGSKPFNTFTSENLKKWFKDYPEIPSIYKLKVKDDKAAYEKAVSYAIDDKAEIKLATMAFPDEKNIYLVGLQSEFLEDKNVTLTLNEKGLLTASDAFAADRTGDYILAAVQAAASVAHIVIAGSTGGLVPAANPNMGVASQSGSTPPADPFQDSDIAARIVDLYRAKMGLLSQVGSQSLDASLKIQLDGLETAIVSLVNKLKGSPPETSKRVFKFEIDPESPGTFPLLTVDEKGLQLSQSSLEKNKDWVQKSSEGTTGGETKSIEIYLKVESPRNNAVLTKIESSGLKKNEQGLRYRLPALCRVSLIQKVTTVKESEKTDSEGPVDKNTPIKTKAVKEKEIEETILTTIPDVRVAQLGIVRTLPKATGNSEGDYNVVMFDDSGALKQVKVTSKNMDPAKIAKIAESAASGARQGLNDSINGPDTDEITALEQQKKLLNLKKEVLEAKKNVDALEQAAASN